MRTAWVATLAMGVLGFCAVTLIVWSVFHAASVFETPRIVAIDGGESMSSAAHRLSRSGVIANTLVFTLYAELTGQATRIKSGVYAFKGGEAMPAVLRHLVNGDFITVAITVPEGMTVHQIGERLQAAG